jgi:hypothetical protein
LSISPILLGLPAALSFSLRPSRHPSQISYVQRAGVRKSTVLSSTIFANDELRPGISAVSGANKEILGHLESLRGSSYFRMYSVDILASCEYMPQELFECYSETCEVYPVDDDEVSYNSIPSFCAQHRLRFCRRFDYSIVCISLTKDPHQYSRC